MGKYIYSPGDIVQRVGADSLGIIYGMLDHNAPVRIQWFNWNLPSWESKGSIRMYCPYSAR